MYDSSDRPLAHLELSDASAPLAAVVRRCSVCEGVKRSGATYFDRASATGASIKAVAESIADDLGFCERHGRMLTDNALYSMRVAQACAAAIGRIEPLLFESVVDERCQRLFFSAGRHCPACSAEEAVAGKLLTPIRKRWLDAPGETGEADTLCWQHCQALASKLPLDPRGQLIHSQLNVLLTAAQGLTLAPGEGLPRALALLGQEPATLAISAMPGLVGAEVRTASLQEVLDDPCACPICTMIGGAQRRWLKGLGQAASDEASGCLWLFAPSCARHVADAARRFPELMPRITSFVLFTMAEQSRQQLAKILRDLAVAQQPKPVWYRPRRRRRDKGAASDPTPTSAARRRSSLHCQGCEAEAIALERATTVFIDLMRHAVHRERLERGHGLCLRHLAHVLPVTPPDTVRSFLTHLHAAHLRSLRAELTAADTTVMVCREAIQRFRGWPTSADGNV